MAVGLIGQLLLSHSRLHYLMFHYTCFIRYLTTFSACSYAHTPGHSLRHTHDLLLSGTQSMLMPVYTVISLDKDCLIR